MVHATAPATVPDPLAGLHSMDHSRRENDVARYGHVGPTPRDGRAGPNPPIAPDGRAAGAPVVDVLYVEDSTLDADLATARLKLEGIACRIRRVETAEAFAAGLDSSDPTDLVLSDYLLPSFDGMTALRMTRARRPDLPFIFVSGVLGEENAIESLKLGATDYVLKQRMERLGPAVRRALAESAERAERSRIEDALRRSEQQLRYTLDAVRIGHWDLDLINGEWPLRSASHDQIFGYDADHGFDAPPPAWNFNRFLTHHVVPADRERVESAFRKAVAGGGEWEVECRIRRTDAADDGNAATARKDAKDGNPAERWIWLKGGVYARGPDGVPLRMSGVVMDVTDRKQAEHERERLLASEREARAAAEAARSEAERAGRLKDDFLATLSHELRTPLNAVLGWAQLLRRGVIPAHEVPGTVEVIERNARLQAQLVEDLLDMSRIISGKLRLNVEDVDLADVARAAVTAVRPAIEAKGIRLAQVLADDPGPVRGDPARLQQIVWNLLSNAVKFTPKGGSIEVRLAPSSDRSGVEMSVRDNGQGMDPSFLPHVFDRFRQEDGSSARRFGGLGVGLSIVRHLVELHGGTASADSEGTGQGATFTVTLPLSARRASASSGVDDTDGRRSGGAGISAGRSQFASDLKLCPPNLRGVRVLVLDDEKDARDYVRRVLEECEAEVLTAGQSTEAFELLRLHRPAVVLSDIGMPEEDGYEFLKRVRRLPPDEGGSTPAVAVTAYARPEDRERALRAGFQMHVVKPVDAAELVAVVATLTTRSAVTGAKAGQAEVP